MLHTLTHQPCSNMYTTPTQPSAKMHKYASLNIDTGHTQKLRTRAHTHTHAHRCAPACTQSQLPVFPPSRSGAPHGPWCHWWGHVLGQRQHRDGPSRAAANYEVMDQHMLMHTHVHTHAETAVTWPQQQQQLEELHSSILSKSKNRHLSPQSVCIFCFWKFEGLLTC